MSRIGQINQLFTTQQLNEAHQLININKHTSFVFATTIHNVVFEQSFEKCTEFEDQNYGYDIQGWKQKKKQLWDEKYEKQNNQIPKETKQFIVSAGADKNIYLWDIDNLNLQNNQQPEIKPQTLSQPQILQPHLENQGAENQNQQGFSEQELNLHHVIIPFQQNLYEFVTCLLDVRLDQNRTYLIVGYESNQIIRYQVTGEFWIKGVNIFRYKFNSPKSKRLQHHNDSVRSIVYFNNQLISCGDDMQLLIQDIEGIVIKRFYFDSIIENLQIWNKNLFFYYHIVHFKAESEKIPVKIFHQSQNLQQQLENQQDDGINKKPIQEKQQEAFRHFYTYGLQECFMIMGENQQNNFQIQIQKFDRVKFYKTLEEAYEGIDKITCFELSDSKNIFYSTENGKLIKIFNPLNNHEKKEIQKDFYLNNNNENKHYEYQILSCLNNLEYLFNQMIIMSFIQYQSQFYVFAKDIKQMELIKQIEQFEIIDQKKQIEQNKQYIKDKKQICQTVLFIGNEKKDDREIFYEPMEMKPLKINYLQCQTQNNEKIEQKDQKIQNNEKVEPYEIFLQKPLLIEEGNTRIILFCGDQLRYYKFVVNS